MPRFGYSGGYSRSAPDEEWNRGEPMNIDDNAIQEREWQLLHDQVTAVLDRFGQKNAFRKGDYWLWTTIGDGDGSRSKFKT
jgi:hypothetical protein